MGTKKKVKPIYGVDKYGLLYQINKPLSENDKDILKTLLKITEKKNGN